jgi:hypothetical protein
MNRHTILLVQPSSSVKTYMDYESVPAAMDGVCAMFEKRLKELNPQMRSITYDINDLYHYVDSLPDLSALVFAPGACCGPHCGATLTTVARAAWHRGRHALRMRCACGVTAWRARVVGGAAGTAWLARRSPALTQLRVCAFWPAQT